MTGTLATWKGTYGWIQPDQPIRHPLARSHKGQIYLSQEDVEQDIDGVGTLLSFFPYADSSGLGAMHCVPARAKKPLQKTIEKTRKEAGDKKTMKGKGKGSLQGEEKKNKKEAGKPLDKDKAEKKEAGKPPDKAKREVISNSPVQGTVVDWRGQVGWIKPDEAVKELEGPEKKKHKGLLYVHATDVDGDMPLIGAQVVYFMYTDEMGFGAEMCQVVAQGSGEKPEKPVTEIEEKRKPVPLRSTAKARAHDKKAVFNDKKTKSLFNRAKAKPHAKARLEKEKGKSGPDLPRERLMDIPMTGEVVAWKGKFGWIMPTEPIDHPEASKHEGKIYVHGKDIIDANTSEKGIGTLEKGAMVQFQVFTDASGLGAEEVLVL